VVGKSISAETPSADERGGLQFALRTIVLVTCACAVVAAYVGWTLRKPQRIWRRGYELADKHWKNQNAWIYVPMHSTIPYCKGSYTFEHRYDSKTGLRIKEEFRGRRLKTPPEFFDGYNTRVRELLDEHGVPSWSVRDRLVSDPEMITMIKSDKMQQITDFPHEVSANLVICGRNHTFSRWGYTSSGTGHSIEARRGGTFGIGGDAIYVAFKQDDPRVVFIRRDFGSDSWLGVFTTDGHSLSEIH
jgi:hypothetical protein